jgi:hypothetical protein
MAISNYGELKQKLSRYLFNQRFLADYDDYTIMVEADANSRLRVLPMETMVALTTVNGDVALPSDYLLWRTVRPKFANTAPVTPMFAPPFDEIDYAHPAYLPPVGRGFTRLFTIEGNTFKVRPVDDRADAYEFHYYRKIPTLAGGATTATNWLITEWPNAYLFGLVTEAAGLGRNLEMAQLYKARRDEVFAEVIQLSALTTGATSPAVRTAEYF